MSSLAKALNSSVTGADIKWQSKKAELLDENNLYQKK